MQGLEWIILLGAAALLLFGGKKIPELAKSFGRAKGEFEKGKKEVEREVKQIGEESAAKPSAASDFKGNSKVVKAAKDLGIDITGKSDDDLKTEIAKTVQAS